METVGPDWLEKQSGFLKFFHVYISVSTFNEHKLAPWDFVHESEHKTFEIHSMY